jgi:hypothetical protein
MGIYLVIKILLITIDANHSIEFISKKFFGVFTTTPLAIERKHPISVSKLSKFKRKLLAQLFYLTLPKRRPKNDSLIGKSTTFCLLISIPVWP